MAYVRAKGNQIAVEFSLGSKENQKRYETTVNLKPNKANIDAINRQCVKAQESLRDGVSWEEVRRWLRGEEHLTQPETLGYYVQHLFDNNTLKHSVLKQYESLYAIYWSTFDSMHVTQLDRMKLERHLSQFEVSTKTKKNAVSMLSQVFEVAVSNNDLQSNPVSNWKFKVRQAPKINPYSDEERDALLDAMPTTESKQFFTFAFHTGARTGEIFAVKWEHFDSPYISIEANKTRGRITTTKTDQQRDVALPPIVLEMLRDSPTRFGKGFIFVRPSGEPHWDGKWVMKQWRAAHEIAGVKQRSGPYPWRHTYISLALSAGAAPYWVAKQAGHDLKTMLEKYASWVRGKGEADQAELDKIYGFRTKFRTNQTEIS